MSSGFCLGGDKLVPLRWVIQGEAYGKAHAAGGELIRGLVSSAWTLCFPEPSARKFGVT